MVYSYIIIIIIRKDRQCKAGRERLTPYQSEDPQPHNTNSCCNSLFYETLKATKMYFGLLCTEWIRISETPRIVSDKSKYFSESKVLVLDTRSNMTSKYGTNFFSLLFTIITHKEMYVNTTNYMITYVSTLIYKWEKTVKLMQIDRLLSASKAYSAETRSHKSGRYTLLKFHIPSLYRSPLRFLLGK